MTPQETEKIKLMQLFKQGKIDTLPDVKSDAYKASKIKDMMSKANTNESNVKEITGETLDRIDGLIDQPLLIKFLDTFEEIYYDFIENGEEFEVEDVITFLEKMLYNRAEDARMEDQLPDGFNEGTPGPKNPDGTPKSNAEMTDDEREDYYNNLDSVDEGSQSELNQELLNFGSQSEVDQYMDSLRQSGDGFDNIEDYIEDFKNYIADKGLDEGVKWMKRIAGVK